LYKRWVDRCRQTVDSLSGGKVGYVHVKAMDSQSFREVYSELLGRCRQKEAVIVDTRHNGGGWLHDDLATLLSGKEYQRFMPRGQYIGSDPFNKWLKPSCVLVCEDNYSNAHGFPWVYKELKIGKLIGAPVPGTMTAVWWETQIDPTLVFGIPQVGCMDMRGQYAENHQLQPDIEVYNTPEKQLQGVDEQLQRAVEEMLKEINR
jgi:C-terminal processing protease CtpA/Prc